jgi:hypothetical protein
MPLNPYFNFHSQNGPSPEPELYRGMHQEVIQIHGCLFLYAKRELTNMDRLFGEDLSSAFSEAKEIEGWIETFDGFEGDGDIISRLGIRAHDEMRIKISAKAFTENTGMRVPRDGDIIYNPMNKEVFEIKFVEHESQFYPLGTRMSYVLRCETIEPSREKIDIPEITDAIGLNDLQETPEEHMPNHADNVLLQEEAAPIIDFSEKSPFGDY